MGINFNFYKVKLSSAFTFYKSSKKTD